MRLQYINIVSMIILVAFVIRTVRNSIYHLFLWQNKEYRLDRMFVHFRTKEGRRFLWGPFSLIKLLLLGVFSVAVFQEKNLIAQTSIWLFGGVILLEAGKNLQEFSSRSLPIPVFSSKMIFIFFITLLFELLFIVTSSPHSALEYLPFLDKSLGGVITIQIGLFSIPARIKREFTQMLAREKLKNFSNLKVIGVTGSYGKTSTKEFIAQLLKQNFDVVQTPANVNTAVGVANTILTRVNKNTDCFVMEAAAYKRGEIREIAGLVGNKLRIAVLTGINVQHLDLFKTLSNIEAAKYELIEALKGKGTAIFNAKNAITRRLSYKAMKEGLNVLLYGEDRRFFAYATNIRQTPRKLAFTIQLGKQRAKVLAPLQGRQNVENVLAAVVVAHELGMSWTSIIGGIKKLKAPPKTMNYRKKGNIILIDDSYNANPDGVLAALNYLQVYKFPKIIVLRPLIELGSEANKVHRRVGKKAANICDFIVLTNRNYYESFMEGVEAGDKQIEVIVKSGREAKEAVEEKFKGKKVIVFEGRESEMVLREYLKS